MRVVLFDGDGAGFQEVDVKCAEGTKPVRRAVLRAGVDDDHMHILARRGEHFEQTAVLDGVAAAVVEYPLRVPH